MPDLLRIEKVKFGEDEVRAFGSALTCYRLGRFDENDKEDFAGVRQLRRLANERQPEATFEELRLVAHTLERIASACHEQTHAEWWRQNGDGWISDLQNGLLQPGTIDYYIDVRRTQLQWVANAAEIVYDAINQLRPASQMAISDERS